MTPEERIIVSRLLKLASNAFSDFGCNDLDSKFYDEISNKTKVDVANGVHETIGDNDVYVKHADDLADTDLFDYFSEVALRPNDRIKELEAENKSLKSKMGFVLLQIKEALPMELIVKGNQYKDLTKIIVTNQNK